MHGFFFPMNLRASITAGSDFKLSMLFRHSNKEKKNCITASEITEDEQGHRHYRFFFSESLGNGGRHLCESQCEELFFDKVTRMTVLLTIYGIEMMELPSKRDV